MWLGTVAFASLHLLCQGHDFLALSAMAILRSVPVNLLALDTAVAIGPAPFAELSGVRVQFNAARHAIVSHFAEARGSLVHIIPLARSPKFFSRLSCDA